MTRTRLVTTGRGRSRGRPTAALHVLGLAAAEVGDAGATERMRSDRLSGLIGLELRGNAIS